MGQGRALARAQGPGPGARQVGEMTRARARALGPGQGPALARDHLPSTRYSAKSIYQKRSFALMPIFGKANTSKKAILCPHADTQQSQ